MRQSFIVAAIALLAVTLCFSPVQSADWTTAAGDVSRSGRTADSAAPPYRQLWTKSWDGENIATVSQLIVAGGQGFIGTLGRPVSADNRDQSPHDALRGKVHAIDLTNGVDLWTFDDLAGGVAHTLSWHAQGGGTVIAATTAGEVVALDAATGKLRWRFVTDLGGFTVNPCLVDDTVLLGSRLGVFYALSLDGKLRWQVDVGAPICQSAAADRGTVYFTDESLRVHAYTIATGQPAAGWKTLQLAGGSVRDYWPVVAKDYLLIGVAPPHRYNWAQTDEVLFRGPGIRARKEADYAAIGTPDQERAEQQAVIESLRANPHNQVLHCLKRADGSPACTPGVFYTGGSGSVNVPAVVAADGSILVEYRTYYSLYDSNSWVNPFSALGKLDPASGMVTQIQPYRGRRPGLPWGQIWIIADESSAFTLAGSQLLVAHQGNFGGLDLDTGDTFAGIGKRDTWGGLDAQSFSRQEWHGGPRSPLSVSEGVVYFVTGARIIACVSKEGQP